MKITLKEYLNVHPSSLSLPTSSLGLWISESNSTWYVKGISTPISISGTDFRDEFSQAQTIYYTLPSASSQYYSSSIDEINEIGDYLFYNINPSSTIPYNVLSLNSSTSEDMFIFVDPNLSSIFENSDFQVLNNNVESSIRSNKFLIVERERSQIQPLNLNEINSASLSLDYKNSLDESNFPELQDYVYDTEAWKRSRYDGSKNITPGLGDDTALTFYKFEGVLYSLSNVSGSIKRVDDIQREKKLFYYNTFDPGVANVDYIGYEILGEGIGNVISCGTDIIGQQLYRRGDVYSTASISIYDPATKLPKNSPDDITFDLKFGLYNELGGQYATETIPNLTLTTGQLKYDYYFTSSFSLESDCAYEPYSRYRTLIEIIPTSGLYDVVQEGEGKSQSIVARRTFIYQDETDTKNIVKVPSGKIYSIDSKITYTVSEGLVSNIEI